MNQKGLNASDIKSRNRGLALKLICTRNSCTRVDLVKELGLTKMTVCNIVSQLQESGFVVQTEGTPTPSSGRNPYAIELAPHAPKIIGIHISRDFIYGIVSNMKCQFHGIEKVRLQQESRESFREKLVDIVFRLLRKEKDPILGIGVSVTSPVDPNSGTILSPTNFFGISNFPVAQILEEVFSLPAYASNDMFSSALAELLMGNGKKYDNFIYIGVSNGIGAGIVSGKTLYEDTSGYVGEIGHSSICFDGEKCSCGNRGCLELYANLPVIISKLEQLTGETEITYRDFARLSKITACDAVFYDAMEKMGIAITNLVNLLDPQAILIGHEGFYLPKKYLKLLERQVNQKIAARDYRQIRVDYSAFHEKAALYGSVCRVLNELFLGNGI
jgi:N-acetylglucosamine repressor